MEWYRLIEWLAVPVFAFLGGVVGKRYDLKSKKLEIESSKNEAIEACKESHSENLQKIVNSFNERLDKFDEKMDGIMQQQLSFNFRQTSLEEKVDKHNNLVERTYSLEKQVAILMEKIS